MRKRSRVRWLMKWGMTALALLLTSTIAASFLGLHYFYAYYLGKLSPHMRLGGRSVMIALSRTDRDYSVSYPDARLRISVTYCGDARYSETRILWLPGIVHFKAVERSDIRDRDWLFWPEAAYSKYSDRVIGKKRTSMYTAPTWPLLLAAALPTAFLWYRDRRTIPSGHCHRCGYDLTGNASGVCPECGTQIPEERDGGKRA